ncbi:MAG TPA: aspartyl protease family protein [Candidatus Limnocylindria bacterium]|nr:aspartyl protease family protein [Candidatus Limnocylindria bacterium]
MRTLLDRILPPGVLAVAVTLFALVACRQGEAAPRAARLKFDRDGHARIPFDLRSQHVWVRGRVNGSDSVWIVVDTGASASVIDATLSRSLSLRTSGQHEALGAGGPQHSTTVEDATIEIGGLSLRPRAMGAIDLSALGAQSGRPMQVILGYELFQSCVVRFDYAAGVMDVWDAKHAPRDLPGVAVPMTLVENHPYVEGVLTLPGRAPLRGRFVIDTGSSLAILLAPDVVEREKLATAFPRTLVAIGRGVGGELRNRVGRAESFALGSLRFSKPTVVMPDSGAGRISAPGSLGNIGGQLLGRCRVTFDYSHHQIRFEPGADFEHPFEADMSGATLTRTGGALVVRWVNPETPAAEAGLQVGDRVIRIDGEIAERVDPAMLRLRLQREGSVVRLEVQRGANSLQMSLTLRRLL